MDLLVSLFDQIDVQQDMLEQYEALKERLHNERSHREKLEKELQTLYASAAPYVTFVQEKYDDLRRDHGEALKQRAEFRQELSERLDQSPKSRPYNRILTKSRPSTKSS